MHTLNITLAGLIVSAVLTGCNNASKVVENPGAITLEADMQAVAAGLVRLQTGKARAIDEENRWREEHGYDPIHEDSYNYGLLAAEIEVKFNITASAKDTADGNLYVEAGQYPAEAVSLAKAEAQAGFITEITASRGNVITMKFKNILFTPKDTLAYDKDPDELVERIQKLGRIMAASYDDEKSQLLNETMRQSEYSN